VLVLSKPVDLEVVMAELTSLDFGTAIFNNVLVLAIICAEAVYRMSPELCQYELDVFNEEYKCIWCRTSRL
jgi:hypothetical protein